MSDFLNNFSKEKYKKTITEEQAANEKISNAGQETEPDEEPAIPQSKDASSNAAAVTDPNSLVLSGAAFEEEKIEIDSSYNQFLLKRTIVICLTIFAIFASGLGVYLYSSQTLAITLVDKTSVEATKWLDDNDVNYDIVEVENKQIPAGTVISQSIPAGEKIGVLDQQSLEVSSGPNMDEVVSLKGHTGESKAEIQKLIAEQGLVSAKLSYEYSDTVAEDKLIRIDFEEPNVTTANYTRSDVANFVISNGSRSDKKNVKVENFVSQTIDSVYTWNADTGIMIDEQEVSSDVPVGYIVAQSVEPGEMLGYGDVLTVEVSIGPGVPTPNFVGYTIDGADTLAQDNKVSIETKESYSNSTAGIVTGQSMAAGTAYYNDSDVVELTVSLGKPFINDMSNETLGSAIPYINELNAQGANLTYTTSEATLSEEDKEAGLTSGMIKSNSYSNSFAEIGANINFVVYA